MSAIGGKADVAPNVALSAYDPKRTSGSIPCCGCEAGSALFKALGLAGTIRPPPEPRDGHAAAGLP
jgi:hypothetical protein